MKGDRWCQVNGADSQGKQAGCSEGDSGSAANSTSPITQWWQWVSQRGSDVASFPEQGLGEMGSRCREQLTCSLGAKAGWEEHSDREPWPDGFHVGRGSPQSGRRRTERIDWSWEEIWVSGVYAGGMPQNQWSGTRRGEMIPCPLTECAGEDIFVSTF